MWRNVLLLEEKALVVPGPIVLSCIANADGLPGDQKKDFPLFFRVNLSSLLKVENEDKLSKSHKAYEKLV